MAQVKAVVDKLLTQASSMITPYGFVCEKILPPLYVKNKTGKLGTFGTDHLRIESTISGGRGAYRRVESVVRSTTSYSVDSHGLEEIVTPDDYDNVELPFDAELDAVMGLSSLLYLKKEKSLADTLVDTSVITQTVTLAGDEQYNNYLLSDPIDDFKTARSTVKSGCGFAPNKAVMDWVVFNTLRYHPQMLDALGFKDNRPGGLNEQELAIAMGVKQLLVAESVYESAKEGQTSSLAAVWGKHIVFFYAPDNAEKYQTSLGYRVQLSGRRATPRLVTKYPIYNPPESKGIICEDHWDMLISKSGAGYSIKSAIA